MRRIHLIVEYDGTNYAGWQRQENALAVQQVLEEALSTLTRERIVVHGASRTDAGVHALGQSCHFDTQSRIPAEKFSYAVNTLLPPDIRVRLSEEVTPDFHARFSTKGKRYRYLFWDARHAGTLNRFTHAHSIYHLDEVKMQEEASALIGTHDFAAFAASGSVVKDTVRTIWRADVTRDGDEVKLIVEGSGFLYNMVRIIAGTLRQAGAGRAEKSHRDRRPAGPGRHRPCQGTDPDGGLLRIAGIRKGRKIMTTTNAMRQLQKANIPFDTSEYTVDESDLSGIHAAHELGIDPDCMFKTLVARGDKKGISVFCIPVAEELDLKKCAAVTGDKKIEMIHVKELLGLTGYIRGGCSPIGMKKKYPTWIDETAVLSDRIYVSAGMRGQQIILEPEALRAFIDAEFADLTKR